MLKLYTTKKSVKASFCFASLALSIICSAPQKADAYVVGEIRQGDAGSISRHLKETMDGNRVRYDYNNDAAQRLGRIENLNRAYPMVTAMNYQRSGQNVRDIYPLYFD